jgi:hypothetical protein
MACYRLGDEAHAPGSAIGTVADDRIRYQACADEGDDVLAQDERR